MCIHDTEYELYYFIVVQCIFTVVQYYCRLILNIFTVSNAVVLLG